VSQQACCNSCDDVKKAYVAKGWNALSVRNTAEQCIREAKYPSIVSKKGEGCQIYGYMLVNKVCADCVCCLCVHNMAYMMRTGCRQLSRGAGRVVCPRWCAHSSVQPIHDAVLQHLAHCA